MSASETLVDSPAAHGAPAPPAESADIDPRHIVRIATELTVNARQVIATATLLKGGATVPFIARYRKEATGELDEVQIAAVRDRLEQLEELDRRRESILASLKERDLLTPELEKGLLAAETVARLEDLYLPFRPKRRTRATIAREKGLEPLALDVFMAQESPDAARYDPLAAAAAYVSEEKGVATAEDALAGARDILAEMFNEDSMARQKMREFHLANATIRSKVVPGKETEGAKFKDYFDWSEPLASAPSHRVLAMRRGEKEGFLTLRCVPDEAEASAKFERMFVHGSGPAADQVRLAAQDGYKRLLSVSMETETRMEAKKRADEAAIKVFSDNLRELLLAAPLGRRRVLAIDPGFRTGCKVVALDAQGKLLFNDVIYPSQSDRLLEDARMKMLAALERFKIEAVAIGNGTAGRETEAFVRSLGLPRSIQVVMVNESGASVYSAGEVAREEFPDHDITVRGAVSIGRRLMDPLAELVKIDPKAIGVGQYQHDVDQNALKRGLDDVVMSCVNGVGVEVNTASKQLLSYVSGLGPTLAGNIVKYRDENGPFPSRDALKKVPRLGPKAFEQAAGFLRVRESANPLDASAVHPESYAIVDLMARDLGVAVQDLMRREDLRRKIELQKYASDKIGLPTLSDILEELSKPGRDPRGRFEEFAFDEHVHDMGDLRPGMKLPGIVTNVTAFGAFVDIGVHQDGLVHVSQLSDRFVKDPAEVVKVQQRVSVTVMEVDIPRKRIALSMKSNPEIGPRDRDGLGAGSGQGSGQGGDARRGPSGPGAPRGGGGGGGGRPGGGGGNFGDRRPAPPKNNWFTEAMERAKK